MEVKIIETREVLPVRPPFDQDHVLPLSHLDNDRNVHINFRYLRAYVNNRSTANHTAAAADPAQVISEALSKALVYFYPYAGTLRPLPNDSRLFLFCSSGKGVPVIHAAADRTLASLNYLDDPTTPNLDTLVPDPSHGEELVHPCILQITVFECGGFCLGASINHSMCDGYGSSLFFNAMVELSRGAAQPSVQPVWDRASLLAPRKPPRVEVPFHEFLQLDKEFSPYRQAIGPVVRECFAIKDNSLECFRAELQKLSGSSFTTFEALGAFIWRARVKASKFAGDDIVKFAYLINIRKLMKPALPAGYYGNGCIVMYVQLGAKELVEQPIWKTAELIKKSKSNATDEYVRSFIDFQELNYGEGITAGKGVSGFTDWRHLGHSAVDFGWGGPVTVLPLSRNIIGSTEPCFFLPYSSANEGMKDGFKVMISLPETDMPTFRVEMDKFTNLKLSTL
ncbi:spermidine sinapoyl-CoA acyltransferase [Telopea speciosissima]|uniref:spermidine sinapoyl-CoA acyltransferase n=1 Tax=Telopea speciosissima TaxID=54955 RepID=UPI001CC7D723|nr:spermidine sinapoyl-CoA acyltransferase [Telopea speciosissima]